MLEKRGRDGEENKEVKERKGGKLVEWKSEQIKGKKQASPKDKVAKCGRWLTACLDTNSLSKLPFIFW